MSSEYHVICLSHNPGILANATEFTSPNDALHAAAHPDQHEQLVVHQHCDLVVGRLSGAFIEFACPGNAGRERRPGIGCAGYHNHTHEDWTDRGWLRLVLASHKAGIDLAPLGLPRHWTIRRVERLTPFLDLEGSR